MKFLKNIKDEEKRKKKSDELYSKGLVELGSFGNRGKLGRVLGKVN